MNVQDVIIGAAIGLLVGGLIAWLIGRNRVIQLSTRLEERDKEITRLSAAERELRAAREELAGARKQLESERQASLEKLVLVQQAEQALKDAFQALSAEALRQNNQSFLDLAATKMGEFQVGAAGDLEARHKAIAELVRPIEEGIKRVDTALGEVEKQRIGAYAEIKQQVDSMALTQVQLKGETANLVKALRAPQVRGRWGEIQLKRVVEMAGMLDHCDFLEQESTDTADGRLRPDMVIKLPGGKQIIVDAKAPLSAYLESVEATDDAARETFLQAHARQVRDHMTKLGAKSYWDQFDATPEFVFMFLPGETFYSAALQHDPSLIEHGVASRVIPASPITLIALLRAVSYGWRQEQVAENAREISENGAELYKRLKKLVEHIERIGSGLSKAVDAYNDSIGSIERSVLPAARRFKDLGAATTDEIEPLEDLQHTIRHIQSAELLSPAVDQPRLPAAGEPT
ncbi:MAG: DNA recombination protein RmuC [Gemmatimonadetes bacterium]|nr:DNA recombination protein RmuC [Gemmatimonadota bacterium]